MKEDWQNEPDLMGWAIHRTAVKLANANLLNKPGGAEIADELVWGGKTVADQFDDILRARIMNICRPAT